MPPFTQALFILSQSRDQYPGLTDPYPTPVRGITVGRDGTTCGLAPPRPIILLGAPLAPVPTGIGVIGVPAAGATAASAIATLGSSPLSPDIAEVTIRAGIAPCHVGGTDIAPTNRA
jgi:hypothetical protein